MAHGTHLLLLAMPGRLPLSVARLCRWLWRRMWLQFMLWHWGGLKAAEEARPERELATPRGGSVTERHPADAQGLPLERAAWEQTL